MQTLRYLSCLYNWHKCCLWSLRNRSIKCSNVEVGFAVGGHRPPIRNFENPQVLLYPKVSLHHRLTPQAITHDQVKVKNWGCLNFQFSFKDPKLTLDLRLRFSLITFKEEWGVHQNIRKHECSKMWSSFTSNEFERFESGCISCRKRYEEISFSGHFNFNFKLNLIIFVKSQICRHI